MRNITDNGVTVLDVYQSALGSSKIENGSHTRGANRVLT